MMELAKTHTEGAHPYFTGPSHTKMAREILGDGPLLCVEQKVILETDAAKARELARPVAKIYNRLPNYRNNWLRMGLTEDDIDNLSDRFIDETFAWGDVDALRARINEHMEAGADHVHSAYQYQRQHWRAGLGLFGSLVTKRLKQGRRGLGLTAQRPRLKSRRIWATRLPPGRLSYAASPSSRRRR